MSGPTKAGEPSMEEILASIRKIIADDPNKAAAEQQATGPALASRTAPGPAAASVTLGDNRQPANSHSSAPVAENGNRANPSFGRLSEALRTTFASNPGSQSSGSFAETRFGQSAPSSPLSSSDRGVTIDPPAPVFAAPGERARSIDSELDDILDEPLSPSAEPAGSEAKPADNAGSSQWAVWRSPSGKANDSAPQRPAASTAPEPSSPSLGRPSGGFYPSAGFSQSSPPPSSTPSTFGKTGRFEPALPGGEADTSSGLGSLVPKRDDEPSKPAAPVAMARPSPRFEPNLGSEQSRGAAADNALAGDRQGSKPAAVVIAAMPSSASPGQAPPSSVPFGSNAGTSSMAGGAPSTSSGSGSPAGGVNVPLPPRTTLFSRPLSANKPDTAPPAAPSPGGSSAIPPADRSRPAFGANASPPAPPAAPRAPTLPLAAAQVAASASALDALAAGFAASNAHAPPTASAASSPAAMPTSPALVAQPAALIEPVAAGPSASAPAQGVPAASSQPRTLEDMVADMVKPMLQKWLTDNMPRIIEKALRSEAGQPGGGGPKLPGT
jgi:cell pole-organizing protein PopZ